MAIQFRLRGLDLRIVGMQNRLQFLHPKVGALPFFPILQNGFLRMLGFRHTQKRQQHFESGIGDAHG
jgi:hypothetical protein